MGRGKGKEQKERGPHPVHVKSAIIPMVGLNSHLSEGVARRPETVFTFLLSPLRLLPIGVECAIQSKKKIKNLPFSPTHSYHQPKYWRLPLIPPFFCGRRHVDRARGGAESLSSMIPNLSRGEKRRVKKGVKRKEQHNQALSPCHVCKLNFPQSVWENQ